MRPNSLSLNWLSLAQLNRANQLEVIEAISSLLIIAGLDPVTPLIDARRIVPHIEITTTKLPIFSHLAHVLSLSKHPIYFSA